MRNPAFREWSKAAQPAGYPDEILFSIGGSTAAAAKAVIHGRDDVFSSSLSVTQPLAKELLDDPRAPVREPGALESDAARRPRSS